MSDCIITSKKFVSDISNTILSRLEYFRNRKDANGNYPYMGLIPSLNGRGPNSVQTNIYSTGYAEISIPFEFGQNRNYLFGLLNKQIVEKINSKYYKGNNNQIVSFKTVGNHFVLTIQAPQDLLKALNQKNKEESENRANYNPVNDDITGISTNKEETLKNTFNQNREVLRDLESPQNQRQDENDPNEDFDDMEYGLDGDYSIYEDPITDNFKDIFTFKHGQLGQVEKLISKLKSQYKISKKDVYKERLRDAYSARQELIEQIEYLNENKFEFMFHAINADLKSMKESLNNPNTDYESIAQRMEFYKEFINENRFEVFVNDVPYKELNTLFKEVDDKMEQFLKDQIKKLTEDYDVTEILDNLNSKTDDKGNRNEDYYKARELLNKEEEYQITVEDILRAERDISNYDKYFMGVDDSSSGGGLVFLSQVAKNTFTSEQNKMLSFVTSVNQKIEALAQKLGGKVDFLTKIDENGNKTPYLSSLYSFTWLNKLKDYNKLFNKFYFTGKFRDKAIMFQNISRNLAAETIVLNPAKLSQVASMYANNPRYKEYFTYSVEEMQAYEKMLKEHLGAIYDTYINELIGRLESFDEYQNSQENSPYKERNVYKRNIWKYARDIENMKDGIIPLAMDSNNSPMLFTEFKDVTFIPKREISGNKTDFYDTRFDEVINDPTKFELWQEVEKLAQFVSETYSRGNVNDQTLALPWFERNFSASFRTVLKQQGISAAIKHLINSVKNIFTKTVENDPNSKDIKSNLTNTINVAISKKIRIYQSQGMTYMEAKEKATQEEMKKTSNDDILTNLKAASLLASHHAARVNTKANMDLIKNYMALQKSNNPKTFEKFEAWYRQNILNRTMVKENPDGVINRPINETKIYTDSEKEIVEHFEKLKDNIPTGNFNTEVYINGEPIRFGVSLEMDLDDTTGKVYEYQLYSVNGEYLSKEEFTKKWNEYVQHEIDNLGKSVTISGIIHGFFKLKIAGSLGLNPVSGNFNRLEGVNTLHIMDATGQYWTPGNDTKSKLFLWGVNTNKFMSNRFLSKSKKNELMKFEKFLEMFVSIQDRRNELDKADNTFNLKDLWYQWSQGLPEFKNQGQTIMNVLQDITITDDNGNEIQFFDGVNFNALDIDKEGNLIIKDEWKHLLGDKFETEQALKIFAKLGSVINRANGNYDANDIMLIKGSGGIFGKALMMFKSWMPAHIAQRYFVSDDKGQLNIDLATGKLREDGRHAKLIRNHPSLALATMAVSSINSFGGSAAIMFGGGLGGAFALTSAAIGYGMVMRKVHSKESIIKQAKDVKYMARFLQEVIIQTLNYPAKLLNIPFMINDRGNSRITNAWKDSGLSVEDVNNIKAIARELAVQVNMLVLKMIAYSLAKGMFDSDDEKKDSGMNMVFNFVQNQLTRASTSLSDWVIDPVGVFTDLQKVGILQDAATILNAVKLGPEKPGKFFEAGVKILGTPTIVHKAIFSEDAKYPWQDKINFDLLPDQDSPISKTKPFKWLHESLKTPEEKAKSEYKKLRKEQREKYEKVVSSYTENEEASKILTDWITDSKFGKKNKKVSYEELNDNIKETGNTGSLSKGNKSKIIKKLVESGMTRAEASKLVKEIESEVNE